MVAEAAAVQLLVSLSNKGNSTNLFSGSAHRTE